MAGSFEMGGEKFVSRGGIKLARALDQFKIDPAESICADLGANVGGFTDCLLRRGAAKVYAIDTGYGVLDYRLRRDDRVAVMERTNALHVQLPELCDLVVIDLGWTPQRLILPKARELIKPAGRIITLAKPQYEAPRDWLKAGKLSLEQTQKVISTLLAAIPEWGLNVVEWVESPIRGRGGNYEYLVLLDRPDRRAEETKRTINDEKV